MTSLRQNAIKPPALVFLVALAIILGAYGFQYIGGLAPCQLCFWQRYPYFVIVPLSGLAVLIAWFVPASNLPRWFIGLCGLAFLVGAGIALYHVGVEWKWWPGPETCSAVEFGNSSADILAQIKSTTIIRCDEIPWSLFGISMAGYNFLLSVAMTGICFALAFRRRGR